MLHWLVLHSLTSVTWLDSGADRCAGPLCQHQCIVVTKLYLWSAQCIMTAFSWQVRLAKGLALNHFMEWLHLPITCLPTVCSLSSMANNLLIVKQGMSHMFYYALQVIWNKLIISKLLLCCLLPCMIWLIVEIDMHCSRQGNCLYITPNSTHKPHSVSQLMIMMLALYYKVFLPPSLLCT